MYIKPDDNLKTLYEHRQLNELQYSLIKKIISGKTDAGERTNNLILSASDALRTLFTSTMINAYAAQGTPFVFVQDFRRLQAKRALSFTYDEVDYPFCKLSKKINGYRGIAIDSLYPRAAAMQALTALNHYPFGIVSLEADNIVSAFQTLYRIQKPLQKYKHHNAMLMNAFINNLFDYVFLLKETGPLNLYMLEKSENTERIVDWNTVLKAIW